MLVPYVYAAPWSWPGLVLGHHTTSPQRSVTISPTTTRRMYCHHSAQHSQPELTFSLTFCNELQWLHMDTNKVRAELQHTHVSS